MSQAVIDVEKELIATFAVEQKDDEDPVKYRARMVRKAESCSDEVWNKLSDPAQKWINDGVDAIQKKEDVPEFPLANGEAADDEAEPVGDEDEQAAAALAEGDNAQPSSVDSAGSKKPAAPKVRKKKSAGRRIKELMVERGMNLKTSQILELLEAEGMNYSKYTCDVVRAEFRDAMRCMEDLGMLSKKVRW